MPATARRYDVFLSHNSADKPTVQVLADRLRAAGLDPFLDTWHLIPGTPWQEGIEQALEDSNSVAVFVGPSGISPWHNEEMRDALDRAVRSRDDYRVIPVLLPGADEGSVSRFLARRVWVDFRSGLDDEAALQRLVAGIKGEAVEVGSYQLPDEPAPYRGLLPFEAEHARFFFGRETDVQRLIARLKQHPFVAVVGASGSGKSSLVKAGLLPKIEQNVLPDSSRWRVLSLTPGSQPLRSLASQLAALAPAGADRLQTADALTERLQTRSDGLRTAVEAYQADAPGPVLLFVDQFEELFTLCQEGPERCRVQVEQVVANLVDVVQRGNKQVRVLITLRADFLDRCLAISDLRELLEDRQLLLGPMDEPALREAIVRPAQAVGALFEKGLVEIILRDVGAEPGMLPLLQQALFELWLRRRGPWFTLEAYEQSGGVLGALQKRADDTYRSLTSAQQEIARSIFLRLTALGEGVSDTRRRVRLEEIYPFSQDRSQVDAVLQTLSSTQARLIVADENTAEVTHEALILQWPSLRRWLEEDREALHIHRHLTESAEEWERLSRDPGELYRGARLSQAEEWAAANANKLNVLERTFLEASIDARNEDAQNLQRQLELEIALANKRAEEAQARAVSEGRRARRLRIAIAILTMLLLPTLLAGFMSVLQSLSSWKLVEGFPKDKVLSLSVSSTNRQNAVDLLCAGTAGVGIGCSQDGARWNIYQQDLPTGVLSTGGTIYSSNVRGVVSLGIDRHDSSRLYAYVRGIGLIMSQNGGVDWEPANEGLPNDNELIKTIVASGDHVLAQTSFQKQLYESIDGGRSWQRVSSPDNSPFQTVYSLHYQPEEDVVLIGTDTGVFRNSFESPLSWDQISTLPGVYLINDAPGLDSGKVMAVKTTKGDTKVFHWSESGIQTCLAVLGHPLVALTTDPRPDSTLVFALLRNGNVTAIDLMKGHQSLGRRPHWGNYLADWEIGTSAYGLEANVDVANHVTRLFLAHPQGLVESTVNEDDLGRWSRSCP